MPEPGGSISGGMGPTCWRCGSELQQTRQGRLCPKACDIVTARPGDFSFTYFAPLGKGEDFHTHGSEGSTRAEPTTND